ncbi:MAG: FAD-dependent oxidoreductase [Spirochaetales bacterium]|jgi:NADPH-dependent 2,4-dienoyl-CoA reductase/sulfur reductase-like enzyme|nr:FAD-dependent oxidoreductase [Spirochaetales bacterium]
MGKKLICIGGTAAGLSAASKAKRSLPDLDVLVFEKTGYVSYGSCGLPYFIGGLIKKPEDLVSLTAEDLRDKRGIRALTRHEVTKIDRARKQVLVTNLKTGEASRESYDYLVIATGAVPLVPDIPGVRAENVFTLRTVEDGIRIREAVEGGVKNAAVVGAGPVGLELAEQFTGAGVQTTMIELQARLLPFLPEAYAREVTEALAKNGVALRTGTAVAEVLSRGGKVSALRLSDGKEIPADIVVLAAGIAPNTALAEDCGLSLGLKKSIVVDRAMRTSDEAVWACGDCAQTFSLITGRPVYAPLGTNANKQGRVAGANIAGEGALFDDVLLSQAFKFFDLYCAVTGMSLEAACATGFDAAEASIVKGDKANYYPGGIDAKLNLVFERSGGRLLGAAGIGGISIAGRINLLAAAITAGMTVAQLNGLDLVYTPSVAPVYDPLLIAANSALKYVK